MINKLTCFIVMFCLFLPTSAFASADIDIVTRVINEFKTQSELWYIQIQLFALDLFLLVATFEVAYIGFQVSLGNAELKETLQKFIYMLLASGFFLACINNYHEWSGMLVTGLQGLASEVTTLETNSSNPFHVGLELIKMISLRIDTLSWKQTGLIIAMYLGSFIVLICFSLITAKIIVIKCESIIALMVAIILLPLGASSLFREYAINTVRYVFSVAMKLFALQLVLGIGFSFIEKVKFTEATMSDMAVVMGFVVVLLAVSQTIPEIVGGIINGSHAGSGSGIKGSMGMAGALATGAVGGAVGGAMAVKRASQIAKSDGAKGFSGMAKGTFQAMRQAQHQSNVRRTSIGTELKDRLNTINDIK